MRKIRLFIASSLDGYIARASGDVDWLFTDSDYGYDQFFAQIDTLIMGNKTYQQIVGFGEYPYKGKESFVFSNSLAGTKDNNVEFVGGNLEEGDRERKVPRLDRRIGRTLRGLTEGRIPLVGNEIRARCLVLGDCFPSWLLHLTSLGYNLDRVLLKHPRFLEQIYLVCGVDAAVWSSADWGAVCTSWPHLGKDVICFLDGRVTGSILGLLMGLGVESVYSTGTPRKFFAGWKVVMVRVTHSKVGGITTKPVVVYQHYRNLKCSVVPEVMPTSVAIDASTVLSQATFGHHFRPKPNQVVVEPLLALNLGSTEHPYYHSYGWLPGVLGRSVRILGPVLNLQKYGGQWGLWSLTGSEVLLCKDVPSSLVCVLGESHEMKPFC